MRGLEASKYEKARVEPSKWVHEYGSTKDKNKESKCAKEEKRERNELNKWESNAAKLAAHEGLVIGISDW